MALEHSGATVVPVGVGQSQRLLELIPRARDHRDLRDAELPRAPRRARPRARPRPARARAAPRRHRRRGGRRAGRGAARRSSRRGARPSPTRFGMSDVWSTMAGECGAGEGMHLTTAGHAVLELVDPDTGAPVALDRRRRGRARVDAPAARGLAASALPLGRPRSRVDRAVRVRARDAADPHRRPPRRHAARAGGQRPPGRDRRRARRARRARAPRRRRRRRPVAPPLRVYVETRAAAPPPSAPRARCAAGCARASR